MQTDLKKNLKMLDGRDALKSFPNKNDKEGELETVENVILNCLANFPVKDKKEMFIVNSISIRIMNAPEKVLEFTPAEVSFLEEILWYSTLKKVEEEGKPNPRGEIKKEIKIEGVYLPFLIAQVLTELGIKE